MVINSTVEIVLRDIQTIDLRVKTETGDIILLTIETIDIENLAMTVLNANLVTKTDLEQNTRTLHTIGMNVLALN